MEVLHQISESIGSTLDLESVFRHIVEIVVEVTKADACLLYLLSPHRDELVLRASNLPSSQIDREDCRMGFIRWILSICQALL